MEGLELLQFLGSPIRLNILVYLLEHGETCVNDIVKALGINQPSASIHLVMGYRYGYLNRQARGTQRYYSIGSPLVKEVLTLLKERGVLDDLHV